MILLTFHSLRNPRPVGSLSVIMCVRLIIRTTSASNKDKTFTSLLDGCVWVWAVGAERKFTSSTINLRCIIETKRRDE